MYDTDTLRLERQGLGSNCGVKDREGGDEFTGPIPVCALLLPSYSPCTYVLLSPVLDM